jgi:hypothetical protein
MGDKLPRLAGAAALGVLVMSANFSAFAGGNRLYNMDRLLSEPHPYSSSRNAASAAPARPVSRNLTPLPGSQYRVRTTGYGVRSLTRPIPAGRAVMRPAVDARVSAGASAVAQVSPPSAAAASSHRDPGAANRKSRSWISEIIVGGLSHDPGQDNNESNTWDFNVEVLFRKIEILEFENRYLRYFFTPNPMIGGTINSDNETHTFYSGLNWQHQFGNRFFAGGSFGLTVHTGNLEQEERQCAVGEGCTLPGNRAFVNTGEVTLGSRILFRESIEAGYRIAGRHGVSLNFAHMSNASWFDEDNDGMNFLGLRYRYVFD